MRAPNWLATAALLTTTACCSGAKVRTAMEPLPYGSVQLTGGPLYAQTVHMRAVYLAIPNDSLLQGFRQRAGLPAPGQPMGGWYDPGGFAAAHAFGQIVSGLARTYATTGDRRYRDKVAALVRGFAATIRSDGYFYASAKVAREWPCYVYDKNCTGMRDAYVLAGCREALDVLHRMTDWAYPHLPRRSDEWYTLPENLYACYALTREPRYLEMASEFDYTRDYFAPLAAGDNALHTSRHAYSHVNCLASAARIYEETGNPAYLRTIKTAWRDLTLDQSYASGGWGPNERFVVPGALADSLDYTGADFETPCGTYATVNLDRYLLRFTADGRYGDSMDRVITNGLLATLPTEQDGRTFYYSDYRPGTTKTYYGAAWPCCSGTYTEAIADYVRDIWFRTPDGFAANLYAPSRMRWTDGGNTITLTLATKWPVETSASVRVTCARAARFHLRLRVPGWCASPPVVRLNGRPVRAPMVHGFASVARTWRTGDVVTIAFPRRLQLAPIDERHRDLAAVMYGPVMLVALAPGKVALTCGAEGVAGALSAVPGRPLHFRAGDGTEFVPFYEVRDERYTTYCSIGAP